MFAYELQEANILVNSVCPGWVKTDMGGQNAPRTTEQGADTIVWLATLPDDGPTGDFFAIGRRSLGKIKLIQYGEFSFFSLSF